MSTHRTEPVGKVLVIDDVPEVRTACAAVLERAGYQVQAAEDSGNGLRLLQSADFDVILLDNHLPDVTGLEILGQLRRNYPATEIVMMTAFGSYETAVAAIKAGAYDFLTKPFKDLALITHVVGKACERRALIRRARDLESQVIQAPGNLIGTGQKMREIFRTVQDVAPTDTTVLITGESGTGKELVAQAVHQKSARKERMFLAINCAALTESLLESELFGHVKGAFTGAVEAKRGVFEAASRGTLFLDEIGDMPLSTQVKLLRVLQEGEIRPVGGTEVKKTDVRIVAATNRSLEHLVEEKKFRQDLFYRLNVIVLHLPPLRQRLEDIPILTAFFLQRYAGQYKKALPAITPEALAILENFAWPGNIRELQHVIERAVVLCKGEEITPALLPPNLSGDDNRIAPAAKTQTLSHLPYQEAKDEMLTAFTLNYVRDLMERTKGNMGKAATLAGMERSNFRRLAEKYKHRRSGEANGDSEEKEEGEVSENA